MRQTLELVIKLQKTVAKELSEALGINHNTCLHRVGRLANLHLIRREEVGLAGPHAAYRFSSIITP
jgi:DNA-binding Lrp family transcriptional regulator